MTHEQWSKLAGRAGAVLNYGIKEKEWLKSSKMARLVAETPYLAECDKPETTAFSHLMIYLTAMHESAKDVFLHTPEDDNNLYTRLFPISGFIGGDTAIIQCCLDLMGLCMLSNYNNDADEDKKLGKYNPINAKKWNYAAESEELLNKINKTITPEIAAVYTAEDALKGYWAD